MRKHYLINPTWRCQNHCRYCWLNDSVRMRPEMMHAAERPAAEWVTAIRRDHVDLVDIAGGEPFLYDGLLDIVRGCPETPFGLSTNGMSEKVAALAAQRLPNVISVNVSYHPDSQDWAAYDKTWKRHVALLRAVGYGVHTNIVDFEDNVSRAAKTIAWLRMLGVHVAISPYEDCRDLGTLLPQGLRCEGGLAHLNVAPDGTAWPCLTTMRSPYWAETALGNWLDGMVDITRKSQPCYLACHDYYVVAQRHEAGDMWRVQARPWGDGT